MSEGGGEVIAFDLFTAMHRQKIAEIQGFGSFKYIQLPNLNKHLVDAKTEMLMNQGGCDIETLGKQKFTIPSFTHVEYNLPDSYRTTLARDDHYDISFSEFTQQFNPDVCLFQAEGALQSWLRVRNIETIKSYLYVQNGLEPTTFIQNQVPLPTCLSNSKFIQNSLKEKFKLESELLYPAIDVERCRTTHLPEKNNEKFTVLFINPNHVKGVDIFLQLAQHFKDIQFKMLEGWAPISLQLKNMAEQLGNVECIERTWNIAEIYHSADLLLVPSQWEEAFGRVVVEAHAAGVPTLASNRGGLPEASGDAGFLVDDYSKPLAWAEKLKQLIENKSLIDDKTELMEKNVERFTPANAAQSFARIING
jgi:glycosyltransferase involved in cell wall biosynthesis